MADDGAPADPVPSGRPRLNLKKRDEGEAKKLEAKRTTKSNPFGAARPREAVLAQREGKSEKDIITENAKKDFKSNLRLSREQEDDKRALEAEVKYAQTEVDNAGEDADKKKAAEEELKAKQTQLDELMAGFEKLATEAAHAGTARRREHDDERREDGPDEYNSFGRRDRGGDGGYGRPGGDYPDSFGDKRRGGGSEDYGGAFGGRRGDDGGDYGGSFGGRRGGDDYGGRGGGDYGGSFGGRRGGDDYGGNFGSGY